jgi:hypothetical protein
MEKDISPYIKKCLAHLESRLRGATSDNLVRFSLVTTMSEIFDWANIATHHMPYFKLHKNWEIKVIPPLHNGIVRYRLRDIYTKEEVSVYCDYFDLLGFEGEPHWEIFSVTDANNKDAERVSLANTGELYKIICEMLGSEPENITTIVKPTTTKSKRNLKL